MIKNHFLTVLTALLLTVPMQAEEKEEEKPSFIDHFTIPMEIGIVGSPVNELSRSGVFFKTCLEYRQASTHGIWAALEYDEYGFDYKDYHFKDVNVTKGTVDCTGVFLGAGYRFALRKKSKRNDAGTFSLGILMQPGLTFASMKHVEGVSSGADLEYRLGDTDFTNFSMKATVQLEYKLNKTFSLLVAHDLIEAFGHEPLPTSKALVYVGSIGFVTTF